MTHISVTPLVKLLARALAVALTITTAIAVSACSGSSGPIIDTKGVNMTVYEEDLAECTVYAEQVETGAAMGKGAAAGGVTGGAVGAIAKGGNIGRGAGIGAVLGASRSGVKASDEKAGVVKRCLRGRGYKVLN
jgi:outer membrane lipoprotein SlyB